MKIGNNTPSHIDVNPNQNDPFHLQNHLKAKIHSMSQIIQQALDSPDKIDKHMCQHLSETILELHDTCQKINSVKLPKTDLIRNLQEAANTIDVVYRSVFNVESN